MEGISKADRCELGLLGMPPCTILHINGLLIHVPLWLKSINGYLVVWVGGSKYCSRAIILIILVTGASWDSKPPKSPVNHWILGWRKTRKAWSVILQTTDRLVAWSNEFMPSQVNSKSWGTLKHYNFSQDNKSPSKCFRIFSLPISLAPLAFGKHFCHQIFHDSCTCRSGFFWEPLMVFLVGKRRCHSSELLLRSPRPPGLKAGNLRRRRRRLAELSCLEALGDSWHQTRLDGDLISWDFIVKPVTKFHKKLRKPTISSEYMYKNINERYIVNNMWLYPDIWHLHQCIENSDREHEVSNMFRQWEVSSNARIVWHPFGLMGSLYRHSSPNNCHTSWRLS